VANEGSDAVDKGGFREAAACNLGVLHNHDEVGNSSHRGLRIHQECCDQTSGNDGH
jgi:hypothetical protein